MKIILVFSALLVGTCMAALPSLDEMLKLDSPILTGEIDKIKALLSITPFAGVFSMFQKVVGQFVPDKLLDQYFDQLVELTKDNEFMDQFLDDFLANFGKTSSEEEKPMKINALKINLINVVRNNFKLLLGKSSFSQHIHANSDKSYEEIIKEQTGYKPSNTSVVSQPIQGQSTGQGEDLVARRKRGDSWKKDWRDDGIVGPVQDQNPCNTCVYFTGASVAESAWAKAGHGFTSLSAQQLNDCARNPDKGNNGGCSKGGGTFVPTFNYIKDKGLTSLDNYPYKKTDNDCDAVKEGKVVGRIKNWGEVLPHGDEEALKKAIDKYGPIAVAVYVSPEFMGYKQGVLDCDCKGGRNHAVTVVGYGYDKDSDKDYWIVKNQWGTSQFGENGYIKMRRNKNNMCDIAGDAVWVEA